MSARSFYLTLSAIVALWIAYAVCFVWGSSVQVGGQRWFWLFDDAMISMRYAWNLAAGNGLTWNPGLPPVEGFTNPLWTLVMAALHLLPHSASGIAAYVQVVSGLCLAATIITTAHLGRALGALPAASLTAAAATGFFYPLNFFSLLGMETGLQALLFTGAALLLVRDVQHNRATVAPWVLLGLAGLARLDSYMFCLIMLASVCLLTTGPARRRHALFGAVAIFGTLGLQTLARFYYYGEPLPNTYYLKMTGYPLPGRIARGLWMTSRTLFNVAWPVYLALPFLYVWHVRHRQESLSAMRRLVQSVWIVPIAGFAGQLFYSVWVGGDAWDNEIFANRFIVIVMPLFFLLMAQAGWAAVGRIAPRLLSRPAAGVGVAAALLIVQSNFHPVSFLVAWKQATLQLPPKDTNYARDGIRYALAMDRHIPRDYLIVAERAGTVPYFMPHHRFLDPLGKTDSTIAHQTARIWTTSLRTPDNYTPGHNKWDCSYTFDERQPEVAMLPVGIITDRCKRELENDYQATMPPGAESTVFLRNSVAREKLDLGSAVEESYKALGSAAE